MIDELRRIAGLRSAIRSPLGQFDRQSAWAGPYDTPAGGTKMSRSRWVRQPAGRRDSGRHPSPEQHL